MSRRRLQEVGCCFVRARLLLMDWLQALRAWALAYAHACWTMTPHRSSAPRHSAAQATRSAASCAMALSHPLHLPRAMVPELAPSVRVSAPVSEQKCAAAAAAV